MNNERGSVERLKEILKCFFLTSGQFFPVLSGGLAFRPHSN
jgi:hypothetical protein